MLCASWYPTTFLANSTIGKLHTEAETEEWDLVFTGKFDRGDLAFDTAVTETARNKNAV